MRLEVSSFRKLPVRAYDLSAWKKQTPPVHQANDTAVLAVFKFAKLTGLTSIPAQTIERLKTDPYYKYCFSLLNNDYKIYRSSDAAQVQARLKAILLDPELANDRDLFFGVRDHLNNFPGHMPGGLYREQFATLLDQFPEYDRSFQAVDGILGTKREIELTLRKEAEQERCEDEANFTKRAAYLKFCLGIFDALVERGFSPEELWR